MTSHNSRFYDEGSDIWFGDFDASDYFRIEESEYYKRVLKHERIKAVDCVLCQHKKNFTKIIFIEAKKNLHHVGKGTQNKISSIAQQFLDSLYLICGCWLDINSSQISLPDGFSKYFNQGGQIEFTLVIKNCPKDILPLIMDDLGTKMKRERLIWNFKIRAYNEELAAERNIVVLFRTPISNPQ